jgi:hypothetical protein
MDSKEAELGLARWMRQPAVHDQMARLWTSVLGGEHQPSSREQILLDVWLRTDDSGALHDSFEARDRADNELRSRK